MRYLKFSPQDQIVFIASTEIDNDVTPAKAIIEAYGFILENQVKCVDLVYDGFTMTIDLETKLTEMVSECTEWLNRNR